jgi:hypothetical protein
MVTLDFLASPVMARDLKLGIFFPRWDRLICMKGQQCSESRRAGRLVAQAKAKGDWSSSTDIHMRTESIYLIYI